MVFNQKSKKIKYHWENVVPGFNMPIDVTSNGETIRINPLEKPKKIKVSALSADEDFYIETVYQSKR